MRRRPLHNLRALRSCPDPARPASATTPVVSALSQPQLLCRRDGHDDLGGYRPAPRWRVSSAPAGLSFYPAGDVHLNAAANQLAHVTPGCRPARPATMVEDGAIVKMSGRSQLAPAAGRI